MSVRDFLAWESGDFLRHELVDGEPQAMAPPSVLHGLLQNELARLIGNHLVAQGRGCEAVTNAGVVPHLLSSHNVRIPDLAVTCARIVPGEPFVPDPVLLIEILSPGNQARTWANVRAYTSIPSVREILVLYSDRIAIDLLRRADDGRWPEEPEHRRDGDLVLARIGFTVALATLYARTGLGT
jgi:Uma2 family endonuclease